MLKKEKQREQVFLVTSSKIDHGQRPITAPVAFTFIISDVQFDQKFLERVYGLPPNLQI